MKDTMPSDVLLAAHISVRYGDRPSVLRDVSLEIRRGEVLGLVGQSGSGKSTLAMAILGLLDRKTGTDGRGNRVRRLRPVDAIASGSCAVCGAGKLPWYCRVHCLR